MDYERITGAFSHGYVTVPDDGEPEPWEMGTTAQDPDIPLVNPNDDGTGDY